MGLSHPETGFSVMEIKENRFSISEYTEQWV